MHNHVMKKIFDEFENHNINIVILKVINIWT